MQRGRRDVQDTVVAVGRGTTSVFRHKSQRRGFARLFPLRLSGGYMYTPPYRSVRWKSATSEPTYRAEQGVAFGSSGCLK